MNTQSVFTEAEIMDMLKGVYKTPPAEMMVRVQAALTALSTACRVVGLRARETGALMGIFAAEIGADHVQSTPLPDAPEPDRLITFDQDAV
jgi:hypothetical protein